MRRHKKEVEDNNEHLVAFVGKETINLHSML